MKNIIFFVFLFCITVVGHSQSIKMSTSAKDVFATQVFDITYTVKNGENTTFTPPVFSPFSITAGPFSSSNISIINGRRSASKSFTYRIQCSKVGTFTIPAAKITTGSVTKKSKSITIHVKKATKENNMQGGSINLEMELNDSTVYVGQQLIIDHHVYYGNIEIMGSALVGDFPRDRFIVNQIATGRNIRKTQLMYNGKMQNKSTICQLALFPMRSGEMEVPDINFDIDFDLPNARRRRSFFSFNSWESKVLRTPSFILDVMPLPANPPESFTGCVGRQTANITFEQKQFFVGQEMFVTLKLSGNGLAEQVSAPKWAQEDFQVFDPKLTNESKVIQNGEIIFTNYYQYLVIPEKEGSFNLKIPVSYFNPVSEKYITRTTTVNLKIEPSATQLTDATSKNIASFQDGIEPVPFYKEYWFWGVIVFLLSGVFVFLNYFRKTSPVEITPEEAARIIAQRNLAAAKDLLDRKEVGKYWETLENALRIYLEEKLEVGTTDYSIDEISNRWQLRKYKNEFLDQWKGMVDKINLARYAGQSIDDMENLYKEALEWIVEVEKSTMV